MSVLAVFNDKFEPSRLLHRLVVHHRRSQAPDGGQAAERSTDDLLPSGACSRRPICFPRVLAESQTVGDPVGPVCSPEWYGQWLWTCPDLQWLLGHGVRRRVWLEDARVVCRQLGFSTSGRRHFPAYFGAGTGPIWMDDVNCYGSESYLASCSQVGWGNHSVATEKTWEFRAAGRVRTRQPGAGRSSTNTRTTSWPRRTRSCKLATSRRP